MLWLARPPYLRWTGVGLLVLASLWIELRPVATVDHPFLARDVSAGESVADAIEWVSVPAELLPAVDPSGMASISIPHGEPLLPSQLAGVLEPIPSDWWTVEIDLPTAARPGDLVQLVGLPELGADSPGSFAGVVVANSSETSAFASGPKLGVVALPPDQAASAAVAIAQGRVSVLIQRSG